MTQEPVFETPEDRDFLPPQQEQPPEQIPWDEEPEPTEQELFEAAQYAELSETNVALQRWLTDAHNLNEALSHQNHLNLAAIALMHGGEIEIPYTMFDMVGKNEALQMNITEEEDGLKIKVYEEKEVTPDEK